MTLHTKQKLIKFFALVFFVGAIGAGVRFWIQGEQDARKEAEEHMKHLAQIGLGSIKVRDLGGLKYHIPRGYVVTNRPGGGILIAPSDSTRIADSLRNAQEAHRKHAGYAWRDDQGRLVMHDTIRYPTRMELLPAKGDIMTFERRGQQIIIGGRGRINLKGPIGREQIDKAWRQAKKRDQSGFAYPVPFHVEQGFIGRGYTDTARSITDTSKPRWVPGTDLTPGEFGAVKPFLYTLPEPETIGMFENDTLTITDPRKVKFVKIGNQVFQLITEHKLEPIESGGTIGSKKDGQWFKIDPLTGELIPIDGSPAEDMEKEKQRRIKELQDRIEEFKKQQQRNNG